MFEREIIDELISRDVEESNAAYAGFLFYAQMSPKERGASDMLKRVAEHTGLSESTLKVYRVQYHWEERSNLLDAHFYKIQFEKRIEAMNESNLKFAEDTKMIQAEAVKASKKAILVVNQLLDNAVLSGETKETGWVDAVQKDGSIKSVATRVTINMKTELKDVAPLLRAAVSVPLQAAGLPTETITPDVSKKIGSVEEMTDEELALQAERIAKERAKLLNEQELPGIQ